MTDKSSGFRHANATTLNLLAQSSVSENPENPENPARQGPDTHSTSNCLKSAQWSADGTCVITNSADNRIRTFVLPPDLLDERPSPLHLESYSQISSHDAADAVEIYPGFNLQDPNTTLVLSAVNEHPIRLHSALTSDLVASYPLVHPTTEAYIKPGATTFSSDGSHFIAGSDGQLSTFDLSRPGQEPMVTTRTGPKTNKAGSSDPTTSMRGIISALGIDKQHNVLAAGTWTRHLGLYDTGGTGACLGVFALQNTPADLCIGGQGITQVLWSPCGTYLYIAERKSEGLLMYDIRHSGQLLGWLEGRHANTNQRMQTDVSATGGAEHEVWAGGTDGAVRAWKNPYQREGAIPHDAQHHVHEDVVNSTTLHPTVGIVATASGQRTSTSQNSTDQNVSREKGDISLRVWSLLSHPE